MTNSSLLFSVVSIVKNDLVGLQATYNSVANQSLKNFEWIVVDGASTDGTAQYASGLSASNIIVMSAPDEGIYDAMNKGLDSASGEFIVFLNSGDKFFNEGTLETVAAAIARDVNLIYGNSIELTAGGQSIEKVPRGHKKMTYGMFACHQTMYYRTSLAKAIRYQKKFRIAGDYDFTTRFIKAYGGSLYLNHPLAIFSPGGVSQSSESIGRKENMIVQIEVLKLPRVKLLFNQAAYRFTSMIRNQLPSLYSSLRCK